MHISGLRNPWPSGRSNARPGRGSQLVNGGGLGGLLTLPLDLLASLAAAFGINLGGEVCGTTGDPITGLLQTLLLSVTLVTSLIGGAFQAATGGATGGITAGSQFVGSLLTGAGGLVTQGAQALAATPAPFAALPIIGPLVVATGDVLGGFAMAGATVLDGIGTGMAGGGAVVAGLITESVAALTTAITGGTGVLTGAINTGSDALNNVLQGFLDAVDDIVPPPATPPTAATDPGAVSLPAATRAAAATAPPSVTSLPSLSAQTLTLPSNASPKAKAPAVTATIDSTTATGADFGKAVSGVASGKPDVSAGGSTSGSATGSGGGSAAGSASNSGSTTGQTASAAGGANGAAHANAHSDGHVKVRAGK